MSTENIETLPEVRAAVEEVANLETFAATYAVTTAEQYQHGAEDLKRVKAAQKRLEETRTGITGPMNAALKRANEFFRAPADRLATIERTIKSALTRFADEQERIRREEQRRAEEIARKEREKLEAQAREAERKAREKAEQERKAAEEARRAAEAAAAAGRAEEARKAAAAAAAAEARAAATEAKAAEKVEAIETRAAAVVAPVVVREAPKVAGVATREVWKFTVTDPALVPREYCVVDEAKIRKVVAALKGDTTIPGVRVYAEKSIAAGAA